MALDIEPIKKRLAKATPGPWEWREDVFRPKYMKRKRDGKWMARRGKRAVQSWVALLTGPPRNSHTPPPTLENIERGYPDEWDYPHIIALRWSDFRAKSLINALPSPDDMALIANAPTDIKALVKEVERLRALLGERIGEIYPAE